MSIEKIECKYGASVHCTGKGEVSNIYGVMMCVPCLIKYVDRSHKTTHYKHQMEQLGIQTLEDWE